MGQVEHQPHSHRLYVIAIIAAGIIGITLGALIGYQIAPSGVTLVQGSVTLNAQLRGRPFIISFFNVNTNNLTSAIGNQTYLVYLPTGFSYMVVVHWLNMTSGAPRLGTHTCNPQPSTYTHSAQNETRNFTC